MERKDGEGLIRLPQLLGRVTKLSFDCKTATIKVAVEERVQKR